MLFPVGRIEKLAITSIERIIKYLLTCTVFIEFTDKAQICDGSEIHEDDVHVGFLK